MRASFLLKAAVALLLIVAFDQLFRDDFDGVGIGLIALGWIAGVVIARRDVRHRAEARWAIGAAILFVLALADAPGLLGWAMMWAALSIAALLPKAARFDDAWRWAVRLAVHGLSTIVLPFRDWSLLVQKKRSGARFSLRGMAGLLAMPVAATALFLALFASANPLIADWIGRFELPPFWRVAVWGLVGFSVWPALRPSRAVMRLADFVGEPGISLPGTSLPSVLIALAMFNLLFAVQNGLDIAFLWSGAALPAGMTMTDYVHRGAYPLIGTALLAGVLALAMLKPGSASAVDPWARRLLTLWVGQNVVLVASSAYRTILYIQTSMLTEWRIAALLWMALVALGLGLICWRILAAKSARWLINWNAAAALAVLAPCTILDLGSYAAAWNVRATAPAKVDLCYLSSLGDAALLPLIDLERRPMDAATRDRVTYVRGWLFGDLSRRQGLWNGWTPRGARRLAAAKAALGERPALARALGAKEERSRCGEIYAVGSGQ